jgi:hypothetical protein
MGTIAIKNSRYSSIHHADDDMQSIILNESLNSPGVLLFVWIGQGIVIIILSPLVVSNS